MDSESGQLGRYSVLADHGQFYVCDLPAHDLWMTAHATDPTLAPAGWTHEAVHVHRIGIEPHSISVGTARTDVVEMTLQVRKAGPQTQIKDAEHVVEADLELPSGDITIYGPADDPADEQHVSIPPGRYRARVSYIPSGPPPGADEDEFGDHFIYAVEL